MPRLIIWHTSTLVLKMLLFTELMLRGNSFLRVYYRYNTGDNFVAQAERIMIYCVFMYLYQMDHDWIKTFYSRGFWSDLLKQELLDAPPALFQFHAHFYKRRHHLSPGKVRWLLPLVPLHPPFPILMLIWRMLPTPILTCKRNQTMKLLFCFYQLTTHQSK